MAQIVVVAVVAAVFVLVLVIATRPATFRIQRSVAIAAPPDRIFPHLDDFRAWSAWSPWEKLDPSMKKTFEGAQSGPGAVYAWTGNNKVGEGRMTILKSEPPSLLTIQLEFFKPYAATNLATFTLERAASGANVTWAMDGKNDFTGKAFAPLREHGSTRRRRLRARPLRAEDRRGGLGRGARVARRDRMRRAAAAPRSAAAFADSAPWA